MDTIEGRIDNNSEVYTWRLAEAEAFDTYHCPTHGARRYSRGEVRQAERDEVCLYICTSCGEVADPTPFDAGAEEEDRSDGPRPGRPTHPRSHHPPGPGLRLACI